MNILKIFKVFERIGKHPHVKKGPKAGACSEITSQLCCHVPKDMATVPGYVHLDSFGVCECFPGFTFIFFLSCRTVLPERARARAWLRERSQS